MNKRPMSQEFFELYGYLPDENDLQSYMEDTGYYEDNPYNSHERRSSRFNSFSNSNEASSIAGEVKGLFTDIIRKAKIHNPEKNRRYKSNEFAVELAFMSLVFISKTALYFVIRYCQEQGYCTEL